MIKTRAFRGTKRKLFLSYVAPHKEVGTQTISRWIKYVLKAAGIDVKTFGAHSTRSAACSAAFQSGVPLDCILSTAGWTNCSTFAKYYNKPIRTSDFTKAVLDKARNA